MIRSRHSTKLHQTTSNTRASALPTPGRYPHRALLVNSPVRPMKNPAG
nr:MAG TPA: hypothetical protein [Caudoviricetes sp.]